MDTVKILLDTDIGSDIDDTWALVMLLKSPELDLKLITTEESDNVYKAKLCAKMCEIAGRTDIPVGIGSVGNMQDSNIKEWVEDYDLSTYPNVIEDGVQAMIDTIMASEEKIIILAIGPCKTLADVSCRTYVRAIPALQYLSSDMGIRTSFQSVHDTASGDSPGDFLHDPICSCPWRRAASGSAVGKCTEGHFVECRPLLAPSAFGRCRWV